MKKDFVDVLALAHSNKHAVGCGGGTGEEQGLLREGAQVSQFRPDAVCQLRSVWNTVSMYYALS
jgi:hypothetical protein